MSFEEEINRKSRFGFGKNWLNFAKKVDEKKVQMSEDTLKFFFESQDFNNKKFIDVGCGSGLFSLAAYNLGAEIFSFDYDTNSVLCTNKFRNKFLKNDTKWVVEQGSILDTQYVESLGKHDFVYSWGVLHHTGSMYDAFKNVIKLVDHDGKLFIAIYNDQGIKSKIWKIIKKMYCKNIIFRFFITIIYSFLVLIPQYIKYTISHKTLVRGMSLYHDMHDWLGGFPFEVATPKEIEEFFKEKDFKLIKSNLVGKKLGCNEFVFQKVA